VSRKKADKDTAAFNLGLNAVEASLHTRIKLYKKRAQEIEYYLSKKPDDWGKFQNEFNAEVNGIFRDIMNFEKVNLGKGCEEKVQKLKRIFINRIRGLFLRGIYIEWSLRKTFGYAGDFRIIDDIYQNNPTTTGFDRLFDNYYQMSTICVAVRNRKEDFKRLLDNFVNDRGNRPSRVMNLASGGCREIKELFAANGLYKKNVVFDCYDNEEKSMEFAKTLLGKVSNVNFFKENALRLAATKDVNSKISKKYDFIYSTGLFDYFNYKISTRLIQNIRKLLKTGGIIAIANVRDKFDLTPSIVPLRT
jgi:SAM-dependent methyltransferase